MIYRRPNYFNKFNCIADKCEDTCCAGWQIVIDEESLTKYKNVEGEYKDKLTKMIDWENGVFYQDSVRRCAFLDCDNLCNMYKNLGEESLCKTCTNYPRHIEEFENIREINLSISCPEVARIILSNRDKVKYVEEEVESEEEEFEEFDVFLHSYLEDARNIIIDIIQNRDVEITLRIALIHRFVQEFDECIDDENLFEAGAVFDKYENIFDNKDIIESVEKEIEEFHSDMNYMMGFSKSMISKLYELERLSEHWEYHLEETWHILFDKKALGYYEMHKEFIKWCKTEKQKNWTMSQEDIIDIEIIIEQLMVYFVYTYFCGAVYDGYVLSKINMIVLSVFCIYEMLVARWYKNEKYLDMEDIELIVYRYSRELEHSDDNLEKLEEISEI